MYMVSILEGRGMTVRASRVSFGGGKGKPYKYNHIHCTQRKLIKSIHNNIASSSRFKRVQCILPFSAHFVCALCYLHKNCFQRC